MFLRRVTRLWGNESGQAIVWVVMMLPLFLSVIGLTIDGGLVFNARRQLQDAADSAARAGATQIDERRYREGKLAIARERARTVAAGELANRAQGASWDVAADDGRVVVRVSREVPTSFLRVARIESVRIGATGEATAIRGIREAE